MCYYTLKSYRDLYFFGYGHGKLFDVCTLKVVQYSCTTIILLEISKLFFFYLDYKLALKEFTMVSSHQYCRGYMHNTQYMHSPAVYLCTCRCQEKFPFLLDMHLEAFIQDTGPTTIWEKWSVK